LRASTAGQQRSLDFDQILSGLQFILSVQESDLERQEEMLAVEQAQGLYSAKLENLHERVAGVEDKRAAKAAQLS
jgi:hypothetical protein